ncbi:MAG: hypothetical protein AXA67_06425 [Methylothermaceae bacteria B42]|nr:MAG: hypothetical protein AXA67_06425 [Methylothermaceae bacteria B42]HHJ39825.1 sulfotransferase [Methylothermaceae bacterium]
MNAPALKTPPPPALPFFPDFFIVGAPRCGTTAMSHYLAHHPEICFSRPKEPHYFSLLQKILPGLDLEKHYLGHCFNHYDPAQHQVLGEGSVSYLYDTQAIEHILHLNPSAKFIIMVRNPVDMVYSYHARLVALLDETEEDFGKAWRLRHQRAQGKSIPKTCRDPFLLQYEEVGKTGKYLQQLFHIAGRDRCLVIVFDDFVSNPRESYLKILDFIQIKDDGRTEFYPVESNKYARSKLLQRILKRPPVRVASFVANLEYQKKRKKLKKKIPYQAPAQMAVEKKHRH